MNNSIHVIVKKKEKTHISLPIGDKYLWIRYFILLYKKFGVREWLYNLGKEDLWHKILLIEFESETSRFKTCILTWYNISININWT